MLQPSITAVGPNRNQDAVVVFVHGFTGDGLRTWAKLADRIAGDPRLSSWDFYTVTYGTSWLPDVCKLWSADADLPIMAKRLGTHLGLGALARYRALVLIAHSMGGLIVQKALVDFPVVADRTDAVILFGTPSNGLVKALPLKFWKRQLADMARSGPFITGLRADWSARFSAQARFSFLAVAGEKDQFVPPESSLMLFAKEQQAVVSGNHVSMLSPSAEDPEILELVARRMTVRNPEADVGDSAARAIERGDFQRLVGEHDKEPVNTEKLDQKAVVRLAIALDAVGRRDEGYDVLARWVDRNCDSPEKRDNFYNDALGAMAGRLKRRWLFSGRRRADTEAAMAHYARGYDLSVQSSNLRQAYYHGINLAFFEFVFRQVRPAAREWAKKVLEICRRSEASGDADEWLSATRGEAELVLGDEGAAFDAYRRFVAGGNDPWKVGSTYLNARTIAAEYADRGLARKLGEIFGDPNP